MFIQLLNKRTVLRFLKYAMAFGSCLGLSSCYVLKQGYSLLSQRESAIPVQKMLADPATSASTRDFIRTIGKIEAFGQATLGLHNTQNYESYVKTDKNYLVSVVNATRPLSFEPYTWNFPFFGKSPYLGFFDEKDARAEAERVKKLGYDVWLRHVDAFSTLGILKDPLYSFMESYNIYDLADMILHEQTHATVWANGQFDFNEQLAVFVGDIGALDFILANYGKDSPEYANAILSKQDLDTFYGDISSLRTRLRALYESGESDAEKSKDKTDIMARFKADFLSNYADRYRTNGFKGVASLDINNAFIDLYQKYTGRLDLFRKAYEKAGSSMPTFLARMAKAAASKDAFASLESYASTP